MTKKLLTVFGFIFINIGIFFSQCTISSSVADVTLQCAGGSINRSGIAFNPNQNLYYSVDAGSTGYPVETFSVTGGASLFSNSQGADYRGLWWNSSANAVEGNTFSNGGVFSQGLAAVTYYANGLATNIGPGPMPGGSGQSCGQADIANNQVLYYDSGNIYKYNKSTGALISTIPITGLPAAFTSINLYSLVFTGITGSEVAIYNYVNRCIYFINYTSGAYVSTCTLPLTAPTPGSFHIGYGNNRFFIYNDAANQWYGYPILNPASFNLSVSASNPTICSGQSTNLTASGPAVTYTWSTGATSFSTAVTPTSVASATNIIYSVVGTNSAGCLATQTISILVNPGAAVSANLTNPAGICPGGVATLNASGVSTYTWNTGSPSPFAPSVSVSPNITSSYTVLGTNSLGCITAAMLTVTVNPLPVISIASSNTFLCIGQTTSLTASGANTYTWNSGTSSVSGTSISASPGSTLVYTVSGTSSAGCFNATNLTVNVYPLLLSVTANTAVCTGKSASLTASGAVSYAWSTGSPFSAIVVAPATSTVYSVTSTDVNNCTATKTISVTVNPLPVVTASANYTIVCKGSPVVLTAGGAQSYTWNTGTSTVASSITVNPPADITYNYTVTGADANGCVKTAVVTVKAVICTGINTFNASSVDVSIFPNPNTGLFNISVQDQDLTISIFDVSGRLVKSQVLSSENTTIDLQKEPTGIYLIQVMKNDLPVYRSKVIRQ